MSPEGEADLHGSRGFAHREADTAEAPLDAAMPGVVRIVGRGCVVVERLDDAAAAKDLEVRGHGGRDVLAGAEVWYSVLCRRGRFGRRHGATPGTRADPRARPATALLIGSGRGGMSSKMPPEARFMQLFSDAFLNTP